MNNPAASPQQCAAEVLETVPLLMRVLRAHAQKASSPELSMPQFRTLAFLGRNEGAMLADVAMFLGLTPPAASKLIDGLVGADLVGRTACKRDRRCVALKLTAGGRRIYQRALGSAQQYLSKHLAALDAVVRVELLHVMQALRVVFDDPTEIRSASKKPANI